MNKFVPMNDHGLIYYLIIAAVYLLSRVLGKKKKPAKRPVSRHEEQGPVEEHQPGPLSFEDILKELTGEKSKPPPQRQPSDQPLEPVVTQPISPVNIETPEPIPEKLEEPREVTQRRRVVFQKSEPYAKVDDTGIKFLEDLNDVHGPAKAFIWSEIFTRKY